VVRTGWIDAVLIRSDLPEHGINLMTAPPCMDVNNLKRCEE
jgi:hypothetical protein